MNKLSFYQKAFQKEKLNNLLQIHNLDPNRFDYIWSNQLYTYVAIKHPLKLYIACYEDNVSNHFEGLYISHELYRLSKGQPSGFSALIFGQKRNLIAREGGKTIYLGVELPFGWVPVAILKNEQVIHRIFS